MERLIIMENGEETIMNITSRVVTIGRSSKNDIAIKDRNASRRHCNIIKVGDSWFVVDCDSQNGTMVNGKTSKKHELEDGDKITVGAAEIVFLIAKDVPGNKKIDIPDHRGETQKKPMEEVPNQDDESSEDPLPLVDSVEEKAPIPPPIPPPPPIKISTPVVEEPAVPLPPPDFTPEIDTPAPIPQVNKASVPPPAVIEEDIQDTKTQLQLASHYIKFKQEFSNHIVGHKRAAQSLFITLVCGGHSLLMAPAGSGKTAMVRTIAKLLGFTLEEFTSLELIDAKDITFSKSTHIVLIDHIEGTPIAPLEARIKKYLTNENTMPFSIVVTHQPRDVVGLGSSYREAFMSGIFLRSLKPEEELQVLQLTKTKPHSLPVLRSATKLPEAIDKVGVPNEIAKWVAGLVAKTRPGSNQEIVKKNVGFGVSIGSGAMLLKAAKVKAVLEDRLEVCKEDVQNLAPYILSHRLLLNAQAYSSGIPAQSIIEKLVV